jgi:tyrosyl-tRNA synthetase
LIKKSDGTKFGKTEGGNVWLDVNKTSPYQFYQFWLNTSDDDAKSYIRIFTLLNKDTIEALEAEHNAAPHLRVLQKALAKDVTTRVHSEVAYLTAVEASEILFGKGTEESLRNLSEEDFLSVFEGVPQFSINKDELEVGVNIIDLLTEKTTVFPSKGEARKMMQGGGVLLNKNKVEQPELLVSATNLISNKYLLAQKGKKNYFLIIAE